MLILFCCLHGVKSDGPFRQLRAIGYQSLDQAYRFTHASHNFHRQFHSGEGQLGAQDKAETEENDKAYILSHAQNVGSIIKAHTAKRINPSYRKDSSANFVGSLIPIFVSNSRLAFLSSLLVAAIVLLDNLARFDKSPEGRFEFGTSGLRIHFL